MIGVPLQGGKTLQVTFRSLNTRVDIFKQAQARAKWQEERRSGIQRRFDLNQDD